MSAEITISYNIGVGALVGVEDIRATADRLSEFADWMAVKPDFVECGSGVSVRSVSIRGAECQSQVSVSGDAGKQTRDHVTDAERYAGAISFNPFPISMYPIYGIVSVVDEYWYMHVHVTLLDGTEVKCVRTEMDLAPGLLVRIDASDGIFKPCITAAWNETPRIVTRLKTYPSAEMIRSAKMLASAKLSPEQPGLTFEQAVREVFDITGWSGDLCESLVRFMGEAGPVTVQSVSVREEELGTPTDPSDPSDPSDPVSVSVQSVSGDTDAAEALSETNTDADMSAEEEVSVSVTSVSENAPVPTTGPSDPVSVSVQSVSTDAGEDSENGAGEWLNITDSAIRLGVDKKRCENLVTWKKVIHEKRDGRLFIFFPANGSAIVQTVRQRKQHKEGCKCGVCVSVRKSRAGTANAGGRSDTTAKDTAPAAEAKAAALSGAEARAEAKAYIRNRIINAKAIDPVAVKNITGLEREANTRLITALQDEISGEMRRRKLGLAE